MLAHVACQCTSRCSPIGPRAAAVLGCTLSLVARCPVADAVEISARRMVRLVSPGIRRMLHVDKQACSLRTHTTGSMV